MLISIVKSLVHAPVAQLDRVTDYESVGRGFESLPAYQKTGYSLRNNLFFIMSEMGLEKEIQPAGGSFPASYAN